MTTEDETLYKEFCGWFLEHGCSCLGNEELVYYPILWLHQTLKLSSLLTQEGKDFLIIELCEIANKLEEEKENV